jgi:hypothetical protein
MIASTYIYKSIHQQRLLDDDAPAELGSDFVLTIPEWVRHALRATRACFSTHRA